LKEVYEVEEGGGDARHDSTSSSKYNKRKAATVDMP
jgi:hypothetical protein